MTVLGPFIRPNGGSAPATPGFNAVAPEWAVFDGAPVAAPAIRAAESALGSHPCVALSPAQVPSEWINRNFAVDNFSSNGDQPLNSLSHSSGSLQSASLLPSARGCLAFLCALCELCVSPCLIW